MKSDSPPPTGLFGILRGLRGEQVGILPRLMLSMVTALVLCSFALLGAWAYAVWNGPRYGGGRFYVRDNYIAVALALGGALWIPMLVWLWSGTRSSRPLLPPSLHTMAVWLITIPAIAAIDEFIGGDEILIAAVCLFAAAITVLIWLPAIQCYRLGRPVLNEENLVNVNCPECGYSLIGLYELRCPECGTRFTLDEIIRRQNYDSATRKGTPPLRRRGIRTADGAPAAVSPAAES